MDIDGDGRISYYELEALIRTLLRVPHEQYSDEKLQAVWLSADTDQSGWWSSTEVSATHGEGLERRHDRLPRLRPASRAAGCPPKSSSLACCIAYA